MTRATDEGPPAPTDGSVDALLRECTADARALTTVFDLPDVAERLDTQFSFTMVARADRLFRLRDGTLWHVEWQSSRDPDMFKRMLEYWVFVRNKVDGSARIRSDVILVGRAPARLGGRGLDRRPQDPNSGYRLPDHRREPSVRVRQPV
ncbi:MAG: hypothetical protein PGN34_23815 [Methylobacterium frigidaeris]